MLARQSRIAGLLTGVLVIVVVGCFHATSAWADPACLPGHDSVVPPCTFDGGLLSLDSASGFGGGGSGHHTLASFPGAGIEIACDTNCPYKASDNTSSSSISFTISTVNGLPLIHDVSLTLLGLSVTGTGSISWSLGGTVSGDQTTNFGELIFNTPQSSITETVDVNLFTGANGDAFANGALIGVSLVPVPEPSQNLLVGTVLVGIGVLYWRRFRRS